VTGGMLTLTGFVVLADGFNMFKVGVIATGGK
jgi:hypothetical protein